MRGQIVASGWAAKIIQFLFIGAFSFLPAVVHGGAGDTLKAYVKLPAKEREAKLIEGAKREGKIVYYGTIAIDQSRSTLRVVRQNYGLALGVNSLGILIGALGALNPVAAAVLHNLSTLAVVANSSRLIGFEPANPLDHQGRASGRTRRAIRHV